MRISPSAVIVRDLLQLLFYELEVQVHRSNFELLSMKIHYLLFPTLSLSAALPAAEAPIAPSSVRVVGVSLLGSGCPAGSADVQIDATKTLMEVTFSEYIVQTGPGTKASDWRKNCKLTLNMAFDQGFQFSTFATEMMGFAQIPGGAKGMCTNVFDFTGVQGDATTVISLPGEREGAFSLKSDPDIISWSPCRSQTAIMNMNTWCNISPTQKQALIAVDRISGKITVLISIQWRRC
ncbi:hypothetical protein OQA88_11588 [Cercophora sp. LCS_1]